MDYDDSLSQKCGHSKLKVCDLLLAGKRKGSSNQASQIGIGTLLFLRAFWPVVQFARLNPPFAQPLQRRVIVVSLQWPPSYLSVPVSYEKGDQPAAHMIFYAAYRNTDGPMSIFCKNQTLSNITTSNPGSKRRVYFTKANDQAKGLEMRRESLNFSS